MNLQEKLEEVSLNVREGKLKINGEELDTVDEFSLTFNAGEWNLSIRQNRHYYAKGKAAFKDAT